MATWSAIKIKELMPSIMRHQHFTWQRSALLGAGLAYSWSEGKWWHTPLIVFAPSAYVGYQAYVQRDQVRAFISQTPDNGISSSLYSGAAPGKTNNNSPEPAHV